MRFNTKFIFVFSSFILFTTLLCFTSCHKETSTEPIELQEDLKADDHYYLLPDHIANGSDVEIVEYLEELSIEEYYDLVDHSKIVLFLLENNRADLVELAKEANRSFAKKDMSYHLNSKEMVKLNDFSLRGAGCGNFPEGFVWHAGVRKCIFGKLFRCGFLFKCENGSWKPITNNEWCKGLCQNCNASVGNYDPAFFPSSSLNSYCNSTCMPSGDVELMASISEVFQNIDGNWSNVLNLYINHKNEIEAMLNSKEAKYLEFQNAFNEAVAVNSHLVSTGFKEDLSLKIADQHIQSVVNLGTAFCNVSDNQPLIKEVNSLMEQLPKLKGTSIQEALDSF